MARVLLLFSLCLLLFAPGCRLLPDSMTASPPDTTPRAATTPVGTPAESAATRARAQKPQPAFTATPTQAPEEAGPEGAAAWTILVYMNVGSDLQAAALRDLDEMEAVGSSSQVNVLVQLNRGADGGSRRYRIVEGDEEGAIDSPPLTELGPLDPADPATIADFIAWGTETFPAAHYGLLLWDYYGGWSGLPAGEEAQPGAMTLIQALMASKPLAVVGFDGSRMGQLPLFRALQDHARYAVASAAPWSSDGRDYEALLAALEEVPDTAPAELARLLVDSYVQAETVEGREARLAMSAVDLEAVPPVSAALDMLAERLMEAPALSAPAVADARAGAETYVALSPLDEPLARYVDLADFARRLAARSPDPGISGGAQALLEAVEGAVISREQGNALLETALGVTFYFPATEGEYRGSYATLPGASTWDRFLAAYHTTGLEAAVPPGLQIVHQAGEVADVQQPGYFDFELTGRDVLDVAVSGGPRTAEGGLRLLAYQERRPEAAFDLSRWQDGVHQGFFVWKTVGHYLGDGNEGDFYLFWPLSPEEDRYAVAARVQPASTARWQEATLIFDGADGELESAWAYPGDRGAGSPRQVQLKPGDLVQPYHLLLPTEDAQSLAVEPGQTLVLPESGGLRYEARPLPGGDYAVGITAKTMDEYVTRTFASFTVNNPEEAVSTLAYLDPYYGFQFLYPASWPAPVYDDGRILAAAPDASTRLTVTIFPQREPGAAPVLKAQMLDQFGAVDLLYEEEIFIGESAGLLVAYGYAAADGAHTGLFFAFVDEGTGYVVDVDGPAATEAETIALADQLVESWLFRPLGVGAFPGRWVEAADDLPGLVPASYRYRELDNGWKRFSGDEGFVAFRHEPAADDTRAAIVSRWLEIAGEEVASFAPEPPYSVALADNRWARANFTYDGDAGPIRGLVMATVQGGEEIVAWAEAPAATFAQLEQAVFLQVIAEHLAGQPGVPGLLYAASFDDNGPWGAGAVPGAMAEVGDGTYRLLAEADEGFFWSTTGQEFASATVEVTAAQTAGPLDSGYGLIFRANDESGNFYAFEISGDGYAWVGRCHDDCREMVSLSGGGWLPAPAVHGGLDSPNRLRVEADGARLTFFVNEQQVAAVADSVLDRGDVGVFVETLGEGGVVVEFSELRVWAR